MEVPRFTIGDFTNEYIRLVGENKNKKRLIIGLPGGQDSKLFKRL